MLNVQCIKPFQLAIDCKKVEFVGSFTPGKKTLSEVRLLPRYIEQQDGKTTSTNRENWEGTGLRPHRDCPLSSSRFMSYDSGPCCRTEDALWRHIFRPICGVLVSVWYMGTSTAGRRKNRGPRGACQRGRGRSHVVMASLRPSVQPVFFAADI